MERFVRLGLIAAAVGGALLACGALFALLPPHYANFSDQVVTGRYALSSGLRLLGAVAMTWGLIALYLRQADRAGSLGLVAVIFCLANMLLQGGWMFADLFVAPSFARAAPDILNGHAPARLSAGFLVAWFANSSFLLLAVATFRARVLPVASGMALLVAGVVTLIPLPMDGPAYEVVIGLAMVVAGTRGRLNRVVSTDILNSANPGARAWPWGSGRESRLSGDL